MNRPVASFLRSYQLDGGFTPGPFLLLCAVPGCSARCWRSSCRCGRPAAPPQRRARTRPGSWPWPACCSPATAVVLLLAQDLVEFSWRYQLPAVITLPPAGILGISALLALRRDGAEPSPAGAAAAPEPAA